MGYNVSVLVNDVPLSVIMEPFVGGEIIYFHIVSIGVDTL